MHVKKYTGKSLSEALIFESVNPQYDERLFLESPKKYKFRTCCVQILFWMSKPGPKQKQKNNNFCTLLSDPLDKLKPNT